MKKIWEGQWRHGKLHGFVRGIDFYGSCSIQRYRKGNRVEQELESNPAVHTEQPSLGKPQF